DDARRGRGSATVPRRAALEDVLAANERDLPALGGDVEEPGQRDAGLVRRRDERGAWRRLALALLRAAEDEEDVLAGRDRRRRQADHLRLRSGPALGGKHAADVARTVAVLEAEPLE